MARRRLVKVSLGGIDKFYRPFKTAFIVKFLIFDVTIMQGLRTWCHRRWTAAVTRDLKTSWTAGLDPALEPALSRSWKEW